MTKLFLIAALMTLSISALAAGGPAGTGSSTQDADAAAPDIGNNCALNGDQTLRSAPGNRDGDQQEAGGNGPGVIVR